MRTKEMDDIIKLLTAMSKELVENDSIVNFPYFNFDDEDNEVYLSLGFEREYFLKLLKKCRNAKYIEKSELGVGFDGIALTQKGQDIVLENELGKVTDNLINIGSINSNNSNLQIGNNNILNSQQLFDSIALQIDNMSAPEHQKEEAKTLWQKVCENQLLCSVIGGLASAFPFK